MAHISRVQKNGDAICVTEPITIRTITCNEGFFDEGYDSDGDIGPFFMSLQIKKTFNTI